MKEQFEVYDSGRAPLLKRHIRQWFSRLSQMLLLTGFLIFFAQYHKLPNMYSAASIVGGSAWGFVQTTAVFQNSRRTFWCVKLSNRKVEGYDYGRKKTSLDWIKVDKLELSKEGITIYGPKQQKIHVSSMFDDFEEAGQRILEWAEFYEIPIYVNGDHWMRMDVDQVFPFVDAKTTT